MFIDIRRWPLARQIAAVSILLSLLVFVIIIGFVWVKGHQAARHVAQDEGNLYALRVRDLVEAEYGHAAQNVQGRMAILRGLLGGQPSVLDETAAVGERPGVRIMKAPNGTVLNNNLALLTDLKGKLDGDPAVMVKQGDDFVRVATLLKDPQGKSLVGSSLARDGKETASLLAGKAYSGVVMRNGKFYMSIFEPVLDRSGVVAGAISFRQDLSPQLEAMRDRIGKMKIAETGYAYVLVPGRDVGDTRFLSHPQFAGKSVAEANNPRLAEVIGRVRSVGEGTLSYDWPDATKDGQMREKIVAVARAPSWGWIVVAGSYADEFSGETRRLALQLSVMALLCAGSFVFALVWGLSRQLRPLAPMLDEMNRIGNGDLRPSAMLHANRDSANEVDRIALVTEVMRSNIAGLIGRIHGSTQQLGSAADGVTGAAAEVAQASQQQSDSASSLAAAIEELSVSVTHVSDGASEAREVSDAARSAAEKGQRTVSAMISGMRRIEDEIRVAGEVVHQLGDRTAQISDVVRVIKDVAEQTNLLALNAAIEAARAGEQGRGFAVVADEVRKLAERTAASTSEIAGTIATVQQEASAIVDRIEALAVRVSEGVTLANDAEAELASIGERSARASDAVAGIDDGVREQSAASQDIARGVERIAKMAECNLATTEANHATAARVRELAHELADSVSSFRV